MSTPLVATRVQRAGGLPALRTTLIVALVARVVAGVYVQAVALHTLIPPLAAILALTLLVTALVHGCP